MSRASLGVVVLVAASALAGCAGAPEEEGAERAVERVAGGDARCTGRSTRWFREGPPAELLLCVVPLGSTVCDRYRVERRGGSYHVKRVQRRGDCVLPAG